MKGKKIDTQFVSTFISTCIQKGLDSQDQIVEHARQTIQSIEEEIKKVEQQKVVRSKLLDVVAMFDKPLKPDKSEEIKILSFFKIQNPHICKHICDRVKNRVVKTDELKTKQFVIEDIVFCIKQLLEHRVIVKIEDKIARGETYDDYMKFVLRENK